VFPADNHSSATASAWLLARRSQRGDFFCWGPCPNGAGGISLGLSLRETASKWEAETSSDFLHVGDLLAGN